MRSKFLALTAAVVLAAPFAPAQAAVNDFRLPEPSQEQPPPDRQGPVAPDVPESRRPAPTPAPAESTPTPTPSVVPPPVIVAPPISATPEAQPTRAAPSQARTSPQLSPVPSISAPTEATPAEPLPASTSTSIAPAPPAASTADLDVGSDGPSLWPWALGGLLAFGAVGFAGWAGVRRRQVIRAGNIPEIERPQIAPSAPLAPAPAVRAPSPPPAARPPSPPPAIGEPLQVSLEPLRLSLTLVNAALAWRLEVTNRGLAPLSGLTIGADMISAHASMSRKEQLSGPGAHALPVQRFEQLEPGESRTVEGEFRLPFGQIVPIRQGNVALLLPLARFRVEAEGVQPVVRTFAVGQPGNGSGLQPFRLDQGPRVYPKLAQRAFA